MPVSKWPEVREKLLQVEQWCREGVLDQALAEKLTISLSTLNEYKRKYHELAEAIQRGKGTADNEVVSSLHKRAVGFTVKAMPSFFHYLITHKNGGQAGEN